MNLVASVTLSGLNALILFVLVWCALAFLVGLLWGVCLGGARERNRNRQPTPTLFQPPTQPIDKYYE